MRTARRPSGDTRLPNTAASCTFQQRLLLDDHSTMSPLISAEPVRIAIFDDNRLVREALSGMLARLPDIVVVPCHDLDVASLAGHHPHVVLLDVGLRDQNSLATATAITMALPLVKIIVMDLLPMNEEVIEFVNAGVAGFVLKDASFEEFVATIHEVAGGAKVLPPSMTESLFAQIAKESVHRHVDETMTDMRLTRREHEVIDLIGEGLSNKEIAYRLNIATHTVKSHVRNVMEKLTLHTRLQIAAYYHREGHA